MDTQARLACSESMLARLPLVAASAKDVEGTWGRLAATMHAYAASTIWYITSLPVVLWLLLCFDKITKPIWHIWVKLRFLISVIGGIVIYLTLQSVFSSWFSFCVISDLVKHIILIFFWLNRPSDNFLTELSKCKQPLLERHSWLGLVETDARDSAFSSIVSIITLPRS